MDIQLQNLLQTITEKLTDWLEAFVAMLPNLVVAVVVVLGFALLARTVQGLVGRLLDRISDNKQVNGLLSTSVYIALLTVGTFIALGIMDLDKTVTSLLAGVGILGLALGFAFQDIAANFISGVLLAVRRPFKVGDLIGSGDLTGIVERVNLRATALRLLDGPLVYIPNKDVFQNPITNYAEKGQRRVDVAVGVSYDDDLAHAQSVALQALDGLLGRIEGRAAELFYTGFGGSSIDFVVRFWIHFQRQPDYLKARSEAIMRIKKAFDDAGISIPFPIRTLDFSLAEGVLSGAGLSQGDGDPSQPA